MMERGGTEWEKTSEAKNENRKVEEEEKTDEWHAKFNIVSQNKREIYMKDEK